MQTEDERLQAKLQDALRFAESGRGARFIGFLDERQAALAARTAEALGGGSWQLWGGFPQAERVCFGAFPAWQQPDTAAFPVHTATAAFRTCDQLTHRDFLGALIGAGVTREVLGDISWTGWSSVPYVDIVATSGLNNGRTVQTLDTKFNDAWRFALGANYKLNEQVKLRTGIAYDNTPVPDAQHRLTSLPDNDRTWLSVGAQYKPTKTSALDVGFAYIFVKDAPIQNLTATGGLVKGTYSDSSWILGGQYSMGF